MSVHDRIAPPAASSREYLFPLALAFVFVVVGTVPYLYGYSLETPEKLFTGFVGRGVHANNSYFTWSRQAQEGLTLFENKLTPESLPRIYFNPEWWIFGKTARWSGMSLIDVFHIYRVVTAFVLLLSLYWLASLCLDTVFQRRLAVALMVFGIGLGWVQWVASKCCLTLIPLLRAWHVLGPGAAPHPFAITRDVEGVTFFGYLINVPHFMMGGAFIVLTYAFLILGEYSGKRRHFALSGLCALVQTLIRPYALAEIYLVYTLFPLLLNAEEKPFNWARVRRYLLAGCMLFPSVLYYLYLAFTQVLGMAGWERIAGHFLDYVMWYGLPFLLLAGYLLLRLLQLRRPLESRGARHPVQLMLLWLALAGLIAQMYPYLAFGEESAFFPFVVVPALIMAGAPLERLLDWMRRLPFPSLASRKGQCLLAVAFVVLCAPTSVLNYARMFTTMHSDPSKYFIDDSVYAAFKWLETNTDYHDVVLAGLETCPFIPRMAGNKTYTGQDMITRNFREKNAQLDRFLHARGDDAFKRNLVIANHVRYFLYGPWERRPNGMNPADHPWLKPVFSQGDTTVYKVDLKP